MHVRFATTEQSPNPMIILNPLESKEKLWIALITNNLIGDPHLSINELQKGNPGETKVSYLCYLDLVDLYWSLTNNKIPYSYAYLKKRLSPIAKEYNQTFHQGKPYGWTRRWRVREYQNKWTLSSNELDTIPAPLWETWGATPDVTALRPQYTKQLDQTGFTQFLQHLQNTAIYHSTPIHTLESQDLNWKLSGPAIPLIPQTIWKQLGVSHQNTVTFSKTNLKQVVYLLFQRGFLDFPSQLIQT